MELASFGSFAAYHSGEIFVGLLALLIFLVSAFCGAKDL